MNYIAYTIVGGRGSMLGPVVGSVLLVWTSNLFSNQGQYSQGLFGLLIVIVVLVARGGIVGTVANLVSLKRPVRQRNTIAAATPPSAVGEST